MIPALVLHKASSANATEEIAATTQRIAEDYTRHRVMEMENSSQPTDRQDDHQDDPREGTCSTIAVHHHLINIQAQSTTQESAHARETMTRIDQDMTPRTDHLQDNHFQALHHAAPTILPIRKPLQTLPLQD
jgi:hypothetical protein